MRVIEFCKCESERNVIGDDLIYCLTVEDDGKLENYGIGVFLKKLGRSSVVPGITYSRQKIEALAKKLSEHSVTPVTLRDVVEDML